MIGFSTAARAQDSDPASDDKEIIVSATRALTATKTDTEITKVPQSVSVVTSQQFEDRGAVNFQDVFRYSAGVSSELDGVDTRGDFFAARGFAVAQYLDGLNRMPSFVYGARLDIFTLDRAEVLLGPSAVLYGGGGAGGLLNAVSKRAEFDFRGEANLIAGTDKRKELQVDVTGGLTDTLAARFVGVARDGELQIPGQRNDRLLAMGTLRWVPNAATDVSLIGIYQKDRLGTQSYLPLTKLPGQTTTTQAVDYDFFSGEPDFNHMSTDYKAVSLLVEHRFSKALSFTSNSRYFHEHVDYAEVYALSAYADAERTKAYRATYDLKGSYQGFNTDNNLSLKLATGPIAHQLLVGADYTWFAEDTNQGWDYTSPTPIDVYNPTYGAAVSTYFFYPKKDRYSQFGVYLQDQMRYKDWLTVVLGVRHDHATSKQSGVELPANDAWSFRGGVIADVGAGFSPYFSYSESFQPVYGSNQQGVAFVPRLGRQYEAGVKWAPMPGALLSVALFDLKESNVVTQDPNDINNQIQTGETGSKGVELDGTVRMPGGVDLKASYSYTRAKVLSDNSGRAGYRVEGIPEHQFSIWGSKNFKVSERVKARVGAGVRYLGDQTTYYNNYNTPPVTLVDAMASLDFGKWSLSVNGSNIFDTKWYTSCYLGLNADEGYCYAGTSRNIMATVHVKF